MNLVLIYDSIVDCYSDVFDRTTYTDMVIRLARLFLYKNNSPKVIDYMDYSICNKQKDGMLKAILYPYMSVSVALYKPVFFNSQRVEIVVNNSAKDNPPYIKYIDQLLWANNKVMDKLMQPVRKIKPSMDLERDLMEWLLDYTNIEDEIDL